MTLVEKSYCVNPTSKSSHLNTMYQLHNFFLGSKDGNEKFQDQLNTATGIVAQASSNGNNVMFEDNANEKKHYPDYSTIPHFPNLQEMAKASDGGRNGPEEISLTERNVKTIESGNAVTEEVVLNASRLQVESETA